MTQKRTAERRPHEDAQRKALRPATGRHTEADIAKLLAAPAPDGSPASPVTRLPRKDILAAEEGVFQWRQFAREPVRSAGHVAELVRALQNGGKPFDALLVFPAGGLHFVMDGHHRLAAYEAANWDEPVPVKVFRGSLDEARVTALQSNSRDKLPMRREDKAEAAWKLVKEEKFSKPRLVDLGLVSNGTIGNMRAMWNKIKEAGAEDTKLLDMPWVQARHWKPGGWTDEETEDWRERKIQTLVDRLIEAGIAAEMGKNTGLVVEALCRIVPDLPMMAVAMSDPDAVLAWMRDFREVDGRRAYHQDEDTDDHVF
jgi:hypothetical protein